MAVKRDKDGNLVREFLKPPGRPAKHLTLQKRMEEEAKTARLEKAFERYFAPSYTWNMGGRPRCEFICNLPLKLDYHSA
jgi:hypothetical protein